MGYRSWYPPPEVKHHEGEEITIHKTAAVGQTDPSLHRGLSADGTSNPIGEDAMA